MVPERPSGKMMGALHAAAAARGMGHDGLHDLAAERFGVTSLTDLTRAQAHELLDMLNGKDPVQEAKKRQRLQGPHRQDAKSGNGGGNGNGNGNGGISRRATIHQVELLDELARQAGFTEMHDGRFVLRRVHLEDWLKKQFGLPAQSGRTGKLRTYTGPAGTISEEGARKAIAALRRMAERRRGLWTARKWAGFANAVIDIGLPYEFDRKLRKGDPLPDVEGYVERHTSTTEARHRRVKHGACPPEAGHGDDTENADDGRKAGKP